jgi:hypothetical protein
MMFNLCRRNRFSLEQKSWIGKVQLVGAIRWAAGGGDAPPAAVGITVSYVPDHLSQYCIRTALLDVQCHPTTATGSGFSKQ